MKVPKLMLSLALFGITAGFVSAQQQPPTDQKKKFIIKKTIDDNGSEIIEETIIEKVDGLLLEAPDEDVEVFIIKKNLPEDTQGDADVTIEQKDGNTIIKIRKVHPDGEVEKIDWHGNGEVPAHIEKHLHKNRNNTLPASKAFLGVMLENNVEVENRNGVETRTESGMTEDGIIVKDVIENTPAAKAGLKAGDVITAIEGQEITSFERFFELMADNQPGDKIRLNFLRDNTPEEVFVSLTERPASAPNFKNRTMEEEAIHDAGTAPELNGTPSPANQLEIAQIDIFPNPSEGLVQVQFEAAAVATTVWINDISGKEIYHRRIDDFDGHFNEQVDISKAARGTLLLSIRQGEKTLTEKIILQ